MPDNSRSRSLEQALGGMTNGPKSLHKWVSSYLEDESGETLSPQELVDLLLGAGVNAPERIEFHLRLNGWDLEKDAPWSGGTAPASVERRARILELLGLGEWAERIDAVYPPMVDRTVAIVDPEWVPWYDAERRCAHRFYWDAYRHLLEGRLSPEAVALIDAATTEIVERLADPSGRTPYQSKGLVVGHVQSGKTANFTGVVAKAIDAGYRLIIVLTGTVEILRSQTQRRLDMELIGTENILGGVDPDDTEQLAEIDYAGDGDVDWFGGRFVSHDVDFSRMRGVPAIRRLTRAKEDYKLLKAGIDSLDMNVGRELADPMKPVWHPDNIHDTDVRIAVVKKNKTVLTKLVKDLHRIHTFLGDIPTLIIDDEADQASVNTLKPVSSAEEKKRTAINELLSQLLGELKRAQYVGYTATPFANVFVSPEDSQDIFPRDFILSLGAPPGYRGGRAYHDFEDLKPEERADPAISNERAFVRDLQAGDDDTAAADEELARALDSFVLTGAVKLWRASEEPGLARGFRHHTMLVHESVKQEEHRALAGRIRNLWGAAGFGSPRANARLKDLFERDFRVVSDARPWEPDLPKARSFEQIAPFIGEVLDLVGADPVVVVNGDKDQQYNQVDFQRERVWRILVGGAKLSRGFTLEGLTITYFKRMAMQADSLMQMGRWFGYRPGYSDLVRLFMARRLVKGRSTKAYDLYEAFGAIMRDEEDFRAQLEVFSQVEDDGRPSIRPIDVPPLVFQQLPWLRPTSRNKMYNARLDYYGIGGQLRDYPRQPERGDGSVNRTHFSLVRPWLARGRFGTPETFEYEDFSDAGPGCFEGRVALVDAAEMLDVLRGFQWVNGFAFGPTLTMIEQAMKEGKLEDWAVLLPELTGSVHRSVDGVDDVPLLKRTRRGGTRGGFSGSSFRQRDAVEAIAGRPDAHGGNAANRYRTGKRGAVLLTFAADPKPGADRSPAGMPRSLGPEDVATLFSLAIPYAAAPKGRIVFSVARPEQGSEPIVDA